MLALTMPPADLDRILSAVEGVRASVTAEIRALRTDAFAAIERAEQRSDERFGRIEHRVGQLELDDAEDDAVDAYKAERRHMATVSRRWLVGVLVTLGVAAIGGIAEIVRVLTTVVR